MKTVPVLFTLVLILGSIGTRQSIAQLDRWDVSVGSIFLHRDTPNARPLVTTTNGTPLLDASQSDFGVYGGVDVYIARQLTETTSTEFRYFGVGDSISSATLARGSRISL